MFSFSVAFFALCLASLAGVLWLVLRKISLLARIRKESLSNQETFFAYATRMIRVLFSLFRPRRLRMRLFGWMAWLLNIVRVFFSKLYQVVEALARVAREKSQKMDWEHHWFPSKDVKGEREKRKR